MAIDPTQTGPTPTLQQPVQATAAQIASLREYAKMLKEGHKQVGPRFTWANGLDRASGDIMSGLLGNKADTMEQAGTAERTNNALSSNPTLPNASSYTTPATPAPGGAASASPFTLAEHQETNGPSPSSDKVASLDPSFIGKVKSFEGYESVAKPDYKQASVGYGTKAKYPGEKIDPQTAESRLQDELYKATQVVDGMHVPMTKGQREALTDLTYNTGSKWTSSGLGEAIRKGDWDTAKQLLAQYTHAGGQVLPGLVNRRNEEIRMMGDNPQLAENTPKPTSSPSSQPWDPNSFYSKTLAGYLHSGMDPSTAQQMTSEALKAATANMPQYTVDPTTGQYVVSQTGRRPEMQTGATSFPPAVQNIPGTPIGFQLKSDGHGGWVRQAVPIVPPSSTPTTPAPPPKPTPAPVSTPAAPSKTTPQVVTNEPTSKGLLGEAPPSENASAPGLKPVAGQKTAMLEPPTTDPRPRLAAISTGESKASPEEMQKGESMALSGVPEHTKDKKGWQDYLDEASSKVLPESKFKAPDLFNPDLNELGRYEENQKVVSSNRIAEGADQIKKDTDRLDAIHNAGMQARQNSYPLKQTLHLLDNSNMNFGPWAPTITQLENYRQSAGRLAKGLGLDVFDWANKSGGEANQVFNKNIALQTLESLRTVLGPGAGQFRNTEINLLGNALGNATLTPEANKVVMNMVDKLNDRVILYDKMATNWAEKHGSLDQRFYKALQKYDDDHKIFTPEEFDKNINLIKEKGKQEPKTNVTGSRSRSTNTNDPLGLRGDKNNDPLGLR